MHFPVFFMSHTDLQSLPPPLLRWNPSKMEGIVDVGTGPELETQPEGNFEDRLVIGAQFNDLEEVITLLQRMSQAQVWTLRVIKKYYGHPRDVVSADCRHHRRYLWTDLPRAFQSLQFVQELSQTVASRKLSSEEDLDHLQRDTVEHPVACIRLSIT